MLKIQGPSVDRYPTSFYMDRSMGHVNNDTLFSDKARSSIRTISFVEK